MVCGPRSILWVFKNSSSCTLCCNTQLAFQLELGTRGRSLTLLVVPIPVWCDWKMFLEHALYTIITSSQIVTGHLREVVDYRCTEFQYQLNGYNFVCRKVVRLPAINLYSWRQHSTHIPVGVGWRFNHWTSRKIIDQGVPATIAASSGNFSISQTFLGTSTNRQASRRLCMSIYLVFPSMVSCGGSGFWSF